MKQKTLLLRRLRRASESEGCDAPDDAMDIDCRCRKTDKSVARYPASYQWSRSHPNIIITCLPSVGQTYPAEAFANMGSPGGFTVRVIPI